VAKVSFKSIRERAAERKGGDKVLASLMPKKPSNKALAKLATIVSCRRWRPRVLGRLRVGRDRQEVAGLRGSVPRVQSQAALFQPAEFWEKLASDKRIVRNAQKIRSVRDNAKFVTEIAAEHGSFGKFLATWPADDQAG
jgi:hypothetical protein